MTAGAVPNGQERAFVFGILREAHGRFGAVDLLAIDCLDNIAWAAAESAWRSSTTAPCTCEGMLRSCRTGRLNSMVYTPSSAPVACCSGGRAALSRASVQDASSSTTRSGLAEPCFKNPGERERNLGWESELKERRPAKFSYDKHAQLTGRSQTKASAYHESRAEVVQKAKAGE